MICYFIEYFINNLFSFLFIGIKAITPFIITPTIYIINTS